MTAAELRAHRERLGLSQAGLSVALGISPRTLENWEQGRRPVPGWLPQFLKCLETTRH